MSVDSFGFVFALLAGFAALGGLIIVAVDRAPFFNPKTGTESERTLDEFYQGLMSLQSRTHEATRHVAEGLLLESGASRELLKTAGGEWYLVAKPQPSQTDLTSREREVLVRLAAGRTSSQVAEDLSISPERVSGAIHDLFLKLGIQARERQSAVVVEDQEVSRELDDLLERAERVGGFPGRPPRKDL